MPKYIPAKLVLIAVLADAWFMGNGGDPQLRLGLLLFGITNVIASLPGTMWVRVVSGVSAFVALAGSSGTAESIALFAWLAWPPAFLMAWATAKEGGGPATDAPDDATGGEGPDRWLTAKARARVTIAGIIVAMAGGSLLHQWLVAQSLEQTAALFVGVPAFLAIGVLFGVRPQSAVGVACKAVTIGLLAALLFLREGFLCVAMSAPLFYFVAILIGQGVKLANEKSRGRRLLSNMALVVFVPMSLEGVTDVTTLERDAWVTETRIVDAAPAAVERALRETPRFDRPLPRFLRVGFPRPTSTRVGDTAAGSLWVINFRGGEMRIDGQEPRDGDLVLKLENARPGFMRWRAISDDSHMTHYMSWRESIVQWEAVDAAHTRVTWTIGYSRDLDPAWYFGPWERYAVRLAAGYLIDAVATP